MKTNDQIKILEEAKDYFTKEAGKLEEYILELIRIGKTYHPLNGGSVTHGDNLDVKNRAFEPFMSRINLIMSGYFNFLSREEKEKYVEEVFYPLIEKLVLPYNESNVGWKISIRPY